MSTDADVVDLLLQQHGRIRAMFDRVEEAPTPEHQQVAFAELRRFLAVHETAEELVTHPATRLVERGADVVDARLAEEDAAKKLLAELDGMDVDDPRFVPMVAELKDAVLAHAEAEEAEEFPLLRANTDGRRLERMATALRAVEAIAPTHPHPRAGSSMTMNLMVGPLASVIDRTRDAVQAALKD